MLEGAFKHEDNKGHSGMIGVGDLQWMTAGRGIVHSEMPATDGVNVGLQLWVNLAAKHKMTKVCGALHKIASEAIVFSRLI